MEKGREGVKIKITLSEMKQKVKSQQKYLR